MNVKIGVLALQGAVKEHMDMLRSVENVEVVPVKKAEDLKDIDGLILPGGESTAIGKLLVHYDMIEPIRERAVQGMPVWGTCAGMILMAKNIVGEEKSWLDIIDISVVRNGYGSQLDSFVTRTQLSDISEDAIPLVFIRAPYIKEVGENVKVLSETAEKITAVVSGNLLATSFHPELTKDNSFHKYFVEKVKGWKAQ